MRMLASTTTVRPSTGLVKSRRQQHGAPFALDEAVPFQDRGEVVSGNPHAHGQLAELLAGDLLPAVGFEGEAQEAGAELLAAGGVVGLRKTEKTGDPLTLASLFLGEQLVELGLREPVQVAQAIERRSPADAEVVGQEHRVVDLYPLRARLGAGFGRDGGHAVEDFEAFPARLAFAE